MIRSFRNRLLHWFLPSASLVLLLAVSGWCDEPLRIRVLSYNIHHGVGLDGKLDLERIAQLIRQSRADVVSLQEVDVGTRRTEGVDQAGKLAELTEMHHVFGSNLEFQGGDYGNAILSRWPIVEHKNHALPSLDEGEPRGALQATLQVNDGLHIVFLATHLDHRADDQERWESAELINELAAMQPHPAILAGDLNALPDSRVVQRFLEVWQSASGEKQQPTFPANNPTRQIDYILFRPANRWNVVESRVIDEPVASDHRPIFAVLALLAQSP